ncbi:PREDICTED: uncharacterized protein LOC109183932 [Ipomoea nil]|uniref:uncharacterized protein LOC109183932 n=1 Tax=Ipomoea nil TaxID=35883 RepID=UPI0009009394|nr:PREDICTED: uncharacterized protein LOC109183932 [Ipomoea nil]
MNNTTQLSVPVLDGKNYNRWSAQMKVLFDYHELLEIVETGVATLADNATEAQKAAHREMKKKDKKALYYIHQGMSDETFEKIEGATTSNEAWDVLLTSYKGDEKIKRVRLQTLRRQYELLHMEPSEPVDAYFNRILALTNDMKGNGEACTEQAMVEKILRTLNPRFEHIVAAIEEANDVSKMTVKQLSGSLRAHEQRMNENKIEKPIEQAFQAQVSIAETSRKSGGSRGRGRGRGGNHSNRSSGGHNSNHDARGGNDQEKTHHQQNSRGRGRGHGRGKYDKSNIKCLITSFHTQHSLHLLMAEPEFVTSYGQPNNSIKYS